MLWNSVPGLHAYAVSLDDGPEAGRQRRRYSGEAIAVCFEAVSGHTYHLRPSYHGETWLPEVLDDGTGRPVEGRFSGALHPTCYAASDEPAPPPVSRVLAGQVVEPGSGEAQPVVQPADAGIRIGAGAAFGGTPITVAFTNGQTRRIDAGTGLVFTLGGSWTPVWHEGVGVGLDVEGGYKVQDVEAPSGSLTLRRFPAIVGVHASLTLAARWSLLARVGVEKDFAPQLSGGGFDSSLTKLSGGLGAMAELGPSVSFGDHAGVDFTFRLTKMDYERGSTTIGANSFGVGIALRFDHRRQAP